MEVTDGREPNGVSIASRWACSLFVTPSLLQSSHQTSTLFISNKLDAVRVSRRAELVPGRGILSITEHY